FARVWRIHTGAAWRVVARFTNGAPALVEPFDSAQGGPVDSAKGAPGRLLLFTSDVDRRWNDFPLHPSFVPFVQEIARYLAARPPAVTSYVVSDVPRGLDARPGFAETAGRALVVNVDARESAVDRLSPDEFRARVVRTVDASKPREQRLAAQVEAHQNYWRHG